METGRQDFKTQDIINVADYFNVSCDYILRGVSAENLDLSENLGLSEKTIETLKIIKYLDPDIISTINCMVYQLSEKVDEQYDETFCAEGISFLQKLSKYLRTNPDNGQYFYISASGKLINIMATSASELPQNPKWTDMMSIKDIDVSDVVVKILFDDACDGLKELRKKFLESGFETEYNKIADNKTF